MTGGIGWYSYRFLFLFDQEHSQAARIYSFHFFSIQAISRNASLHFLRISSGITPNWPSWGSWTLGGQKETDKHSNAVPWFKWKGFHSRLWKSDPAHLAYSQVSKDCTHPFSEEWRVRSCVIFRCGFAFLFVLFLPTCSWPLRFGLASGAWDKQNQLYIALLFITSSCKVDCPSRGGCSA